MGVNAQKLDAPFMLNVETSQEHKQTVRMERVRAVIRQTMTLSLLPTIAIYLPKVSMGVEQMGQGPMIV